jgi:protoheme IX farnesyltransferase
MMPVVQGHRSTATQMAVYSVAVWALTLLFWVVADMGWIYLGTALVLGVLFTGGAIRLRAATDPELQAKQSIQYFHFSITHLTVLFAALAVDQLVGWGI